MKLLLLASLISASTQANTVIVTQRVIGYTCPTLFTYEASTHTCKRFIGMVSQGSTTITVSKTVIVQPYDNAFITVRVK